MSAAGSEPPSEAAGATNPVEGVLSSAVARDEILPEARRNDGDISGSSSEKKADSDRREIIRALEVVERDSAAIAQSYASLFSTLRLALSEVTSTSVENMQCFSYVVGSLQESALDAATKGNRYINSCLRLNEELKSMEGLALHLKTLRRNVDSLELAVDRLLRLH